ncbi:MAG: CocE/NonD family hydrolase [Candidatus Heimdallarchaeota archaeon]|nr:CocE/NonD family hydrolase [Candidatus Heimdallarchaeota archaeon]
MKNCLFSRNSVSSNLNLFLMLFLLTIGFNTISIQPTIGDATTDMYENPTEHMVPMRDGVKLATNVYLPKGFTDPLPTLLIRTPYSRENFWSGDRGFYDNAILQSLQFPVVVQDTRGRYHSEGTFHPLTNESLDGYDTIQWVLSQDWNNGEIVTMGWSALGITQYAEVISESPGIKAQFISVSPANYHKASFPGGAYRQGLVEDWFDIVQEKSYIPTMRQQEIYSDFWSGSNMDGNWDHVKAPAVFLGGWFDIFIEGTIDGFNGYQTLSDPSVQGKSYIVVGPWTHDVIGTQICCTEIKFPSNSFDDEATVFIDMALNLFLHETKGTGDLSSFYPINLYVMGPIEDGARGNFWVRRNTWPKATDQSLYLHANSVANFEAPTSNEKSKSYIYDPLNPVPSIGGNHLFDLVGPNHVFNIDNRKDTIIFETAALSEDLLITGESIAKLFVKSNATDTDFVVRVSDVYTDTKIVMLHDGVVRMKWRDSNVVPSFINPSEIYEIDVNLAPTSYIFNKGHKIRVSITSSSYPAFSINKNDGSFINTTDDLSTAVLANNTIFFDADHPSRLILPVVNIDDIHSDPVETTTTSTTTSKTTIVPTQSESSSLSTKSDENALNVKTVYYPVFIIIFYYVRRRKTISVI